ncbi:hypothetical protein AALP_AA8G197200 [Arabis alpina]|uniref:Uncharacterized protein n=1 Tax=Arabis alpina TaxID=50452 RepID=A0A087G852_ARAAL|nr:hypothetical protein AALP_AA8G197200 [Arabis alpina]
MSAISLATTPSPMRGTPRTRRIRWPRRRREVSRVEGEVAELKSSSKDAVARAVREAKETRYNLRRCLEIMEERSRAQTEVDCLASLASQVVGAIRRMDKAAKEGSSIDAAKKEKLEARLVAYTAEADQIVLPPLPVDSSDDEGVEPSRNVSLDISSMNSSEDEAERTEVDDRMTEARKTFALTRAEIGEATNVKPKMGRISSSFKEGMLKITPSPLELKSLL